MDNSKNLAAKKDENMESQQLAVNTPAAAYVVHKVRKGESLSGVARKYNVPMSDIKELNSLKTNNLQSGQKLKIKSKG
jgi:LysM repeat protein